MPFLRDPFLVPPFLVPAIGQGAKEAGSGTLQPSYCSRIATFRARKGVEVRSDPGVTVPRELQVDYKCKTGRDPRS
jgi:hypothetical protein